LVILLAIVLTASSADAAEGSFGLGVIAGEPSGITAKIWLGNSHALDFDAAWSFAEKPSLTLCGDYLWHYAYVFGGSPRHGSSLYVGIGGRARFHENSDLGLGARVPIGFDHEFRSVPIEFFIEAVPTMNLTPSTNFSGGGGLGIRYYF